MDPQQNIWTAVLFVSLFTMVVNIPFGYLRQGARKMSLMWWIYVHFPIPLIIFLRLRSGVPYPFIPIFVAAAIAGQYLGGKIRIGESP